MLVKYTFDLTYFPEYPTRMAYSSSEKEEQVVEECRAALLDQEELKEVWVDDSGSTHVMDGCRWRKIWPKS